MIEYVIILMFSEHKIPYCRPPSHR